MASFAQAKAVIDSLMDGVLTTRFLEGAQDRGVVGVNNLWGPTVGVTREPLQGTLDLSPDLTQLGKEQSQTEISTAVRVGKRQYGFSSGGGGTLQVTDLGR